MRPAPAGLSPGGVAAWVRLVGPIAHRGLWSEDAPENTLPAFARAAEAGYGIELDVRLSADGVPMVFHDEELDRLTEEHGPHRARTARELRGVRVGGLEEIPTLAEAIRLIDGRVLMLVELKADRDAEALTERTLDVIDDEAGPLAVISFSSALHREVARLRPDLLRGVHITPDAAQAQEAEASDAHFLLPSLDVVEPRDCPQIAWTARTAPQYDRTRAVADGVIFEGFRPEPHAWR